MVTWVKALVAVIAASMIKVGIVSWRPGMVVVLVIMAIVIVVMIARIVVMVAMMAVITRWFRSRWLRAYWHFLLVLFTMHRIYD